MNAGGDERMEGLAALFDLLLAEVRKNILETDGIDLRVGGTIYEARFPDGEVARGISCWGYDNLREATPIFVRGAVMCASDDEPQT